MSSDTDRGPDLEAQRRRARDAGWQRDQDGRWTRGGRGLPVVDCRGRRWRFHPRFEPASDWDTEAWALFHALNADHVPDAVDHRVECCERRAAEAQLGRTITLTGRTWELVVQVFDYTKARVPIDGCPWCLVKLVAPEAA